MTDEELWARLVHLALQEHEATSDLIETLAGIDERGVYKKKQYVSLFELCVKKLRYSEAAAYRRIRAARAIRLIPAIAGMYRSGALTLETIALLHPFLKHTDATELVARARGLTVAEVERLVAPRREEPPAAEEDPVRVPLGEALSYGSSPKGYLLLDRPRLPAAPNEAMPNR